MCHCCAVVKLLTTHRPPVTRYISSPSLSTFLLHHEYQARDWEILALNFELSAWFLPLLLCSTDQSPCTQSSFVCILPTHFRDYQVGAPWSFTTNNLPTLQALLSVPLVLTRLLVAFLRTAADEPKTCSSPFLHFVIPILLDLHQVKQLNVCPVTSYTRHFASTS